MSSLLRPGTCLQFLWGIRCSIPTARRFSSNIADARSRAFLKINFWRRKKSLRVCALGENWTRNDFLLGTRLTYEATGDAGSCRGVTNRKTPYKISADLLAESLPVFSFFFGIFFAYLSSKNRIFSHRSCLVGARLRSLTVFGLRPASVLSTMEMFLTSIFSEFDADIGK